jgi:hypothetical protein
MGPDRPCGVPVRALYATQESIPAARWATCHRVQGLSSRLRRLARPKSSEDSYLAVGLWCMCHVKYRLPRRPARDVTATIGFALTCAV